MVVAIALPMTLAYISTPLLGIVDTGVVGQLDNPALLGGFAVGAILFDIVFTTFNFLRSATTGLVAQAVGAQDIEQQRVVCIRSLVIAAISGIIVLILAPLILQTGLSMMSVPDKIAGITADYFVIRIWAAPFSLINYSILGWLLGQARVGTGLLLQTVLNGMNICLSIWLGLHLNWGIDGVAWATVVAEGIAAVAGLTVFWLSTREQGKIDWARVFNKSALSRLFGVNRDIMIRSFCLLAGFAFFTAQSAKFGEVTLAANAILMNFFMLSGYMLDGFASAAEQLAGKAVGANYRPAFERTVKLNIMWGATLSALITLSLLIFGQSLVEVLTVNDVVREEASHYLIWAALTAIVGMMAFLMDGVYIGATWSRDMRNMMLVSLFVFVSCYYLLVPSMGNHGLWLSLEIFLGIRGFSLLFNLPRQSNITFGPSQNL